jgi:hypothetical protein
VAAALGFFGDVTPDEARATEDENVHAATVAAHGRT